MEPQPHVPAAEPGTADFFLEVAARMGARVAAAAQWQPDGRSCTWTVMSPDRDHPELRVAKPTTASGTLYEGTSGIGLFLAELWNATGRTDDALARAAAGAIRFALDETAQLPEASFGFHGGRVGIAYAAAVVGRLLGEPELLKGAEDALRPAAGQERQDRGLDVIGGGGGAVQALIALATWLDDAELPMGIARGLGEHLIAAAEHEPGGWAWGTMRGSAQRHLCGYAHGSAGVGHALLELYLATGDSRYRYAMEQAFLYENQFFSAEASNWPDLRHNELGEYLYAGRQEELRQRLLGGEVLAPQPPRYMSAWCHGAPGIGLSRLRAWQTLGEQQYLDDAKAALQSTLDSLADARMNYSLCHGRGGNAETLMVAAEILGDEQYLQRPREAAMEGWEAYESQGKPWPCGTMQGVSDPGLLLGDSGIAYFLLRLARPETPSVLLVTPPAETRAADDGGAGYAALRDETLKEHFGRTLALFELLGESDPIAPRGPGLPERSDVDVAREALAARVRGQDDPSRRDLLADAFRLDRERYDLARSVTDFTDEFVENLVRVPDDEVRWSEARIGLSSRARVVHGAWDWDAYLEAEAEDRGEPEEADTFYLLQASGARVTVRRLSPFAALVLQAVETPATLDEVVDRVQDAISTDGEGPGREWLEDRVTEQLRQAYRAGFVAAENGVTAGAA
ncbi:lanthionine synthetase LanC family protein [Longimicrobium sp.]|uniref:lanthionine synthetase LanC family protein n=1 Tax=Longimicrobium sp. TaxID=2029185 RepID=UPI002D139EDE|nr:lanthionine synthetase LanC family protein [Longimicrobium sp.]HSU13182.1 lanthionine synthetase LanC family protein [Longimicrobium sp.]